jgi:hypothetical protein
MDWWRQAMREAHREAAEALLTARNEQFKDTNVLDLHGLHVSEALIYTGKARRGGFARPPRT